MGWHRRFHDADWSQEGPHGAEGPGIRLKPGQGADAASGRSDGPESERDVEWCACQNVSRRTFRALRVALTHGE